MTRRGSSARNHVGPSSSLFGPKQPFTHPDLRAEQQFMACVDLETSQSSWVWAHLSRLKLSKPAARLHRARFPGTWRSTSPEQKGGHQAQPGTEGYSIAADRPPCSKTNDTVPRHAVRYRLHSMYSSTTIHDPTHVWRQSMPPSHVSRS